MNNISEHTSRRGVSPTIHSPASLSGLHAKKHQKFNFNRLSEATAKVSKENPKVVVKDNKPNKY